MLNPTLVTKVRLQLHQVCQTFKRQACCMLNPTLVTKVRLQLHQVCQIFKRQGCCMPHLRVIELTATKVSTDVEPDPTLGMVTKANADEILSCSFARW
jgi:hypothetical protein